MRGIIELYVTQLLSGAVPAHDKGGKGVQLYMVGHKAPQKLRLHKATVGCLGACTREV